MKSNTKLCKINMIVLDWILMIVIEIVMEVLKKVNLKGAVIGEALMQVIRGICLVQGNC
jgi:hypothetical protein